MVHIPDKKNISQVPPIITHKRNSYTNTFGKNSYMYPHNKYDTHCDDENKPPFTGGTDCQVSIQQSIQNIP